MKNSGNLCPGGHNLASITVKYCPLGFSRSEILPPLGDLPVGLSSGLWDRRWPPDPTLTQGTTHLPQLLPISLTIRDGGSCGLQGLGRTVCHRPQGVAPIAVRTDQRPAAPLPTDAFQLLQKSRRPKLSHPALGTEEKKRLKGDLPVKVIWLQDILRVPYLAPRAAADF